MPNLMRCPYCGLLQDEPEGVKTCSRCGGGLEYDKKPKSKKIPYLQIQMELDQVNAPANQNVERYLLLTLRSPEKVPAGEAAPAGKKRPALNFTSVLDVSGSMHGQKIFHAKEAVRLAVRTLSAGDQFSLVTFSNEVKCPFEPGDVDDSLVARVDAVLKEIRQGGGTALCGGLETGIEKAATHKKENNLLLLLSDGEANVGESDLEKVGQRALAAREQGVTVSTLGVGMEYNEALMVEVATQGGGRFYHVTEAAGIPAFVKGELGEVAFLAARDVEIHLSIPNGATLVPLSAAYPVRQGDGEAVVTVGVLPCATELEIPLRLALLPQETGSKLSLEGTLEFKSPAGRAHSMDINRVTIRFVEKNTFQIRDGVVMPVAEKVFTQMKAASVMGVSRTRATHLAEASVKTRQVLDDLHSYALLLGEDRAEEELRNADAEFNSFIASPAASKQAVMEAFRKNRGSKDFYKGK